MKCSFCEKADTEVRVLVQASSGAVICNECAASAREILADDVKEDAPPPVRRAVVLALDAYRREA